MSVFLGPRAMNHSCNVSWQFWSEADWAGEFWGKKRASAITANTHGHKKSLAAPVCLLAKQERGNLLSGTINVKHRNRLDTLKNLSLLNSHESNGATDLLYIFFCFVLGCCEKKKKTKLKISNLVRFRQSRRLLRGIIGKMAHFKSSNQLLSIKRSIAADVDTYEFTSKITVLISIS